MRQKVYDLLSGTGLDVVYRTWDEGADKPMPYICYRVVDTDNFQADNCSFCAVTNWAAELYSQYKDDDAEAKIEKALCDAELPFNKYESQIEKGIMQVLYLFTTIGE